MDPARLYERYRELQEYAAWSAQDAARVRRLALVIGPCLQMLVDDFYAEIDRHPQARKVITGGPEQVARLKGTLINWLRELVSGEYDAAYVARRWRVGYRHVEIGLDQVYTNVALSRLRTGMLLVIHDAWCAGQRDFLEPGDPLQALGAAKRSLNKLLDLDLAIIEDAYQAEHLFRQQQAERLATIGQIAAGVAHELRNPLNVIRTSVYYLLHAKSPTPQKTAEHLARIEKQVGLADGVVTALSNFARLPLPDLQTFSLQNLVKDALELASVPRNVEVIVECPATLPAARGDLGQLQIVFGNLFRNAFEAMPGGGRLTITAQTADGVMDISVSDTGHGIAPENLRRVMEPLFTTKARGLGLGLALSRAIVHKNQGQLSVASEPGQGSTFTVRLLTAAP